MIKNRFLKYILKKIYFLLTGFVLVSFTGTIEKFYGKNKISFFIFLLMILIDIIYYIRKSYLQKNIKIILKRVFLGYLLSYIFICILIMISIFCAMLIADNKIAY